MHMDTACVWQVNLSLWNYLMEFHSLSIFYTDLKDCSGPFFEYCLDRTSSLKLYLYFVKFLHVK